ncbi:hypothetical protein CEP70_09470 [Providencia stuartii]|nr:hypothetical protein BGK56_03105 [Providencia stuartii]AVL40218.1 hypothetical protein CEP70_09470 [Providencia stuartii]
MKYFLQFGVANTIFSVRMYGTKDNNIREIMLLKYIHKTSLNDGIVNLIYHSLKLCNNALFNVFY